jgi:hypothetical protein
MPRASFLKPSLIDNYAAHEHVKPKVEPNPTLLGDFCCGE